MKDITRVLIETTLRKALKDMKDSPARSARNLIDLGLEFAKGRFHKRFLKVASDMLKNKKSSYYDLIQDTVSNVDTEKLITFGCNVGYNSCTFGANKIREIEKDEGFNIPWSIYLEMSGNEYIKKQDEYRSIIKQGEELGVYTWFVFVLDNPINIINLFSDFPDSAFIMLSPAMHITEKVVEEISRCSNLLTAVEYTEETETVCKTLREKKLPYSVYVTYSQEDVDLITGGNLLSGTEGLRPVFTAMISDSSCSKQAQKKIYEYVAQTRENQEYHTIPWDLIYDSRFVDSVISEDDCLVAFDLKGQLINLPDKTSHSDYNIFSYKLKDILKFNFKK